MKCNNINVNLNGFRGNAIGASPALRGLATDEAQAEAEGANGANSGNDGRGNDGRPSGPDSNSKFVCINNNNNVVNDGNGDETDPCAISIEACFEEFLSSSEEFATLTTALENGLDVVIEGEPLTLNTFADICSALEGLTFAQLHQAIIQIIVGAGINSLNFNLLTCIAQALDIPIPTP